MVIASQGAQDCVGVWELVVRAADIALWRDEVATAVAGLGGDRNAVYLARLAVSELLGNVVKHVSDPRCRLVVEQDGSDVCIQVCDRSKAVPAVADPSWDAESGRGLRLLQEVVPDWGYVCFPDGKSVWVRLSLTGSRRADS
jgi:anti-sigma regulatory factor (Ser/Thr protein kinase)